MSLADKVAKITVEHSFLTVLGIKFRVTGKSLLDGSEVVSAAHAANKKRSTKLPIDAYWLSACVEDASDGSTMTPEQWAAAPKQITGSLIVEIMRLNNLDDEDIERDPKGSSATET